MEALIALLILFVLAGPILGVIALMKTSALEKRLRILKAELALRPLAATAPATFDSAPVAPLAKAPAAETPVPEPLVAEPAPSVEAPAPEIPVPVAAPSPVRNVEQALASRWLVWLGGGAIALGGLLLIKYANDSGLIPPVLRVLIGLAAGAALVVAAEWLRLKRGEDTKDYVPAALSAAGLIIAFGVTYAAYALYDIVAPAVCFPLLAAISLGALWLSKRQGPLIAALGLVGATFAPALVPSDNPSTSGFFAYLLVIVAASLWQLRSRDWWWLGYAAIASGLGWGLLWITDIGTSLSLPIGIFALALGAAAVLVPRGRDILAESMGNLSDAKSLSPPMGVAIAGCVAAGIVLATLVLRSGHAFMPLVLFAIGMAALVAFGWLRQGIVLAPLLAALTSLAVLMSWREVGFYTWAFDEQGFWTTVPGLFEPPRFRNTVLLAWIAFTLAGVMGTLLKTDKRPWAALASGSAFLFLFGAWGKADFTLAWSSWALLACLAIAALLFAGSRLLGSQEDPKTARSLEIIVGGVALLAWFALDRALDGVWLTLALAVLAAAIAYATRYAPLPVIGGIASAVASFAALRLFVSREFWGEPRDLPLGSYWILYGYGVPAALFWQSAKMLPAQGFTRWRVAFEGISLGLSVSLVSLLLRVVIGGGIVRDEMGLLELGAHGCAWLGAAYGLAYRQNLYSTFVSVWGARVLLVAGCLASALALTDFNPVFTGDPVAGNQVFNALWLAYLAPVPLLALIARKLDSMDWGKLRNGIGVFALVLLMTFVTLLVKRQFQSEVLDIEFLSQAESYAVSLAWLVTGIGIFVAGLKLARQSIRYAGLAILVLTVLKVFGYDVFSLGGLWRIASVIGLGLCLVGVGWLYTRFIGQPKPVT